MPRPEASQFRQTVRSEDSAMVATRVGQARAMQQARCEIINARLETRDLRRHCILRGSTERLLEQSMRHLDLSARARDRILKVARTIADLERAETILDHHLAEAIQLRRAKRTPLQT
jgi:magnesium chelatase family protein